jgi:hypothetical protein
MLLLSALTVAGLLTYPPRNPGPELQRNGGFEHQFDGWTARHYTIDTSTFHSGRSAARLDNADQIPRSQAISQLIPGKHAPGFYRVSAWIKTDAVGVNGKGKGVRIGIRAKEGPGEKRCSRGCGFTKAQSGTNDWSKVELEGVYLSDPSLGIVFTSDAYRNPSGTYWLDDVIVVREDPPPLDVFLRVPNYRGILWSDQPQMAVFEVRSNAEAPSAAATSTQGAAASADSAGAISAVVTADGGSSRTFSVQEGRVTLDLSMLPGPALTVDFRQNGRSAHPAFRLVRRPAAQRDEMTVTFSADGRFLVRGKPTFLLGVYDSGLGYTNSEPGWESAFAEKRRLFELPGLNGYINYWFGNAPTRAMRAMMNVLQEHDILYWQTANCFGQSRYGRKGGFASTGPDPLYATSLGQHPGLGGWYLADECVPALADDVFADHRLLQERDPDGVNLGVFNSRSLKPWLPALDVIGIDQYPMYGAEPAAGYPMGKVYEGATAVRQAVGDARPFWHVIQFFRFTSKGRWPTRGELRSMSYAAIVGGANGLFYWSLGAKALGYVCKPTSAWCPERVEYFERLKSVFAELNGFGALSNEDLPSSALSVSDPALKVRIKRGSAGAARYYAIVYNNSPESRPAVLKVTGSLWGTTPVAVSTYGHGRAMKVESDGRSFTDSFEPWGVRVYEVR